MDWDAFFALHRDLPREGPGEAADVAWALEVAGVAPGARVADAGCGPGADIAALLTRAGAVVAVEAHAGFVAQARARYGGDGRVEVIEGDMGALPGRFDFIWCAGALYFFGVTAGLQGWRANLAPGAAVAFSEPCWFVDAPSARSRANWADYPAISDAAGIRARVRAAGYRVLDTRRLSDAAWEAYYGPLDQRIAALREGADAALAAVLDAAAEEAAAWRAGRREFGYLLVVAEPVESA